MRYLLAAMQPRPFIGSLLSSGMKALGGALTSFGGPVLGALIGREGQKDANVANAQQAERQMQFQEQMSRTAHQREVDDLRAAGLNPILSGTGGAGAPVPAGAAARMENVDENTAATAQQIMLNKENLTNLRETTKNIQADTTDKVQRGWLTSAQAEKEKRLGELHLEQERTQRATTIEAEHRAAIAGYQAKGYKQEGEIDDTRYGAAMRYIDRAMRSLQGGSSAIRNVK